MLAGGAGCSHPHAMEQARKDFKIYMSKLLEHSATLDTFRPGPRQSEGDRPDDSPAWGPPVGSPEYLGSVEERRASPPAGAVDLPVSFSPSYFREERSWPRAGASTSPRPRPPPNFSWVAQPRTSRGAAASGTDGGGAGRPLLSQDRGDGESGFGEPSPSRGVRSYEELDDVADEDGGWKAAWSRRFARGPVHTEYQDRFPWPPPQPLPQPSLAPRSPVATARAAPPGRAIATADVGGASVAAASIPSRHAPSAIPPRPIHGAGAAEEASKAEDEALPSPRPSILERQPLPPPPGAARGRRSRTDEGVAEGRSFPPAAVAAVDPEVDTEARVEEADGGLFGCSPYEPMSPWEVIHHVDGVSDEAGGGGGTVHGASAWESRAAEAGSSIQGASWAGAGSAVGVWGREMAGREATSTSGGRIMDHSSQSILTEYMDEFAWPPELPLPGRRGKRTGMGMDHVGRLLAGKRAEEPRRGPDASLVALLGTTADRALKSGSPGHLAEMCRLKSPSPTARRLVLGLVVALGLRWRRWSDIRVHVLGSKSELLGYFTRFDKDRVGLTSASIRPFAEDPSLSPAQVRQVAACMVWLSRWLRALHDYLAVKEGNTDVVPLSRMPTARAGAASERRQTHRHKHGTASRTVPGTAPGTGKRFKIAGGDPGEEADTSAAALARVSLTPPARIAGAAAAATARNRGSASAEETEDESQGRRPRRSSQAAATRGTGSSCPPTSSGGTNDVASRGGAADGDGVGGARKGARRGGEARVAAAAVVSFAGSGSSGDLGSESAWTAGTVTSRGDVLEAPTEDQVDIGSSVAGEQNARTVRERYTGGDVGGDGTSIRTSSRGRQRRVRPSGGRLPSEKRGISSNSASGTGSTTMGATRATTAPTETPSKDERTSGRGRLAWGPHAASHACIYRHEQKGKTASRFANPKARRPARGKNDPILANARWPPPAEVRNRDRTEQRSAFSLEHSFLAMDIGRE